MYKVQISTNMMMPYMWTNMNRIESNIVQWYYLVRKTLFAIYLCVLCKIIDICIRIFKVAVKDISEEKNIYLEDTCLPSRGPCLPSGLVQFSQVFHEPSPFSTNLSRVFHQWSHFLTHFSPFSHQWSYFSTYLFLFSRQRFHFSIHCSQLSFFS